MLEIHAKLAGLERLRAVLADLPGAAKGAAEIGLRNLAEMAADDLRRSLSRETDRSSVPGTPPQDPQGRIADAVTVEPDDKGAGANVRIALPFAVDLEFGTSRMAARPFLRPAAARIRQNAAGLLASRLNAALRPR